MHHEVKIGVLTLHFIKRVKKPRRRNTAALRSVTEIKVDERKRLISFIFTHEFQEERNQYQWAGG